MRELSFYFKWFFMSKKFFTYNQQLDKLEKEKGLIISDRAYAEKMLKSISYYSLIGGYKHPFKHMPSGNYKRGVTFEEIVSLYFFDEKIRSIFLEYIMHVERQLKSLLSYYFCEKYGESQAEYLNPNNYNLNKKNNKDIIKMVNYLANAISLPSKYGYIVHHVHKYNNVPLWVVMNAITFGNLSKMYQYSMSDIRTKISRNYMGVSELELHQFIRVLASCRNTCAHGERLFTFFMKETGPDTILHKKLDIPLKNGMYSLGKHDLFSVVISLRYLIPNEEFKKFKHELKREIIDVLKKCPHISEQQLYKYMGFPTNWDKITRYKK